jgi:hypothetical protein
MKFNILLRSTAILLLLCTFLTQSTYAQEKFQPQKAIGMRFFNTSDFSLIYKKQIKPQQYRRFTAAFFRTQYNHRSQSSNFNLGAGLYITKENHHSIDRATSFYHGLQYGANGQVSALSDNSNTYSLNLGLGYIMGIEFKIKNKLGLSLDITPSANVNYQRHQSYNEWNVFTNFNMSSVAFNIQYYFNAVNNNQT